MKTMAKAFLATGLFVSTLAAQAQEGAIGANVALTTDYVYRGISQTSGGSALQGGFDFASETGFYVGTWASSITFDDSIEIDYYAGFTGSLTEAIGYELGLLFYDYPGMSSDDFLEAYAVLNYGGLSGSINYSADFYAGVGKAWYYTLGYEFAVARDVTLGLHYGLQTYEQATWGSQDSYSDYNISVSKSYSGLDFALLYTDTDLSAAECAGSSDCASSLVFSVGKTF